MKNISDIKRSYSFFSNMENLEFVNKQRENKKSKFFIKNNENYYTLCCDSKIENRKLLNKLEILNNIFEDEIPKVLFKEKDFKYIVTEYVGNGDGISLFDIEKNNIKVDANKYADILYQKLIKLHNYKIDSDLHDIYYKNWYISLYNEFYRHTKRLYKLGILEKEECDILIKYCRFNRKKLKNTNITYIHGDLTPRNVCINMKTGEMYFIDFDMFQLGDCFIDNQKIIWTQNQSEIFRIYVEKYCKNYNEELYLLYWIKIKLFWLPFAYRNKVDYRNALEQTKKLINMAKEIMKK